MIKPYIEARIRRSPPPSLGIVGQSTAVVAFGEAQVARVATLGLNPSRVEFLDRSGALLTGDSRRLATLESLGAPDLSHCSSDVVAQVLSDCNGYFQRQPYRRWFDQLHPALEACGASYDDGTACHLDLVQWATDPVWGKLPREARSQLIAEDSQFLRQQLLNESIEILLINGMAAWTAFSEAMKRDLSATATEPISGKSRQDCRLFSGLLFDKIKVVAWSTNLQSSFGVTRALRQYLGERIKQDIETRP